MPGLVRNPRFRDEVVRIGEDDGVAGPTGGIVSDDVVDQESDVEPTSGWWSPLRRTRALDELFADEEQPEATPPVDPEPAPESRLAEVEALEASAAAARQEADAALARAMALYEDTVREGERLVAEARAQAEEILQRARHDAELMREEMLERARTAEAELVAAREEAFEGARQEGLNEGFDAGYADGRAAAEQECRDRVTALSALVEGVVVDRRELLRNAEAEVTRLALAIARAVLNREPSLQPATVQRVAEAALRSIAAESRARVRVHPLDEQSLAMYLDTVTAPGVRSFDIVADPAVTRGGVIVEAEVGTVDARFETQLEEIARELIDTGVRAASRSAH